MRTLFAPALALLVTSLALAPGCGSSDSSTFGDGDGGQSDGDTDGPFDPSLVDGGGGGDGSGDGGCGPNLAGILRDFKGNNEPGGHPDFETITGSKSGLDLGIVKKTLGADLKPVFAGPTKSTTTQANFDQWYRDTPGVNKTKIYTVPFQIDGNGHVLYDTTAFYPLDNDPDGFGNTPGQPHDYAFTYELHTEFLYTGGEVFSFRGDDDVWAFINHQLVVDLGGVHNAESATIDIDSLAASIGIQKGQSYAFDFFFAERHTVESNFRFETTLKFTNCNPILPR